MFSDLRLKLGYLKAHGLFIRNTGMYLLAVGLNRGMSFLLLPILTIVLSPGEYGIVSLAAILIGFLKCIIGLNPSLFVIVNYYKSDRDELSRVISNLLVLLLATSLLFFIPYMILGKRISYLGGHASLFLVVIFLTAVLIVIESLVLTLIQMEKNGKAFFIFSLISAGFQLILVLTFVVGLKWNWQGKLLGDLLAEVSICLILLNYLRKHYPQRGGIAWERMKHILTFSLPLLPHSLSLWGMNFIDRLFLEQIMGIQSVGLYSAAYNLGLGLMLIYDAFQRAWQPFFFESLEKGDGKTRIKIARFTWVYYGGAILLFIIVTALSYLLKPLLFGEEFRSAIQFVPLIFLGYTFHGMYRVIAGHLYFKDHTTVLAVITVSSALLNLALNYWLITKNGTIGAAQATAITYLFMFLLTSVCVASTKSVPLFYFLRHNPDERASSEDPK